MASADFDQSPRLVVTPDDHRAIVVIVVVICLVWSITITAARFYWRFSVNSLLGIDDAADLLGTIFSLIQGGLILGAVRYGFAKVTPLSEIETAEKYIYASRLLYILGMCASRATVPLLISRLTRIRRQLIATHVLLGITIAWGVGSALAVAFGCGIPVPWDAVAEVKCSQSFMSWACIEATGLFIELLFQALIIALVWNLKMSNKSKIAVILSLLFRLLLVIAIAYRMEYLRRLEAATVGSREAYVNSVNVAIATQIVLHYSLWYATTLPCMGPFLRAFDTGLGATINVTMHHGSSNTRSGKKSSGAALKYFSSDHELRDIKIKTSGSRMLESSAEATVQAGSAAGFEGNDTLPTSRRSTGTSGSVASSKKAIIKKTTGWKVEYDEEPRDAEYAYPTAHS